jgi:hypothetical protein
MHAGDMVLIEYTSSDFVTALMVRDTLGHQGVKEDDTTLFKATGSKILLPFKAPAEGTYYFVFMTRFPSKVGKFKASIFIYNSHNNHINPKSTFCEKLKYVTSSSYTGFEFLKDKEKQDKGNSYFTSSVEIIPGVPAQLNHDMGDTYTCSYPPSADLAGLKKKFDELERNMTACLTDHKKKVFKIEEMSDIEKRDFVKKVEFTLNGSYPKDLNALHAIAAMKDKVILELAKQGTKYSLRVEIQ